MRVESRHQRVLVQPVQILAELSFARGTGAGRRRLERRPARSSHLIQDDAEAVGVGRLVGRSAFESLRSHVHGRLGPGHARLGDAQSAVQAHEQVRGLEVAVAAHTRVVGVLEAAAGQDAETQHFGEGDGVPSQPPLEGAPHLGLAAVGVGRDVVVDHSLRRRRATPKRSPARGGVRGSTKRPRRGGRRRCGSPSRLRPCPSPRSRRGPCAPRRRGDARDRRGPAPPKASHWRGPGGAPAPEWKAAAGVSAGRPPGGAGAGKGRRLAAPDSAPSRAETRRGRESRRVPPPRRAALRCRRDNLGRDRTRVCRKTGRLRA